MVGVEEDVEALVDDPFARLVGRGDGLAVQEDAQRLGVPDVPVLVGHLLSLRREPGDVLHVGPVQRPSLEPAAAVEDAVRAAQVDEHAGEEE